MPVALQQILPSVQNNVSMWRNVRLKTSGTGRATWFLRSCMIFGMLTQAQATAAAHQHGIPKRAARHSICHGAVHADLSAAGVHNFWAC